MLLCVHTKYEWNLFENGNCLYKDANRGKMVSRFRPHKWGGVTGRKLRGRCCEPKLVSIVQTQADFTHRHIRTVSALRWRWGEGRKNSERSRACSHTSHSYSTRGPGTHSHLQRAPQTLVTVGTSAQGPARSLQVVDTIITLHHDIQHF